MPTTSRGQALAQAKDPYGRVDSLRGQPTLQVRMQSITREKAHAQALPDHGRSKSDHWLTCALLWSCSVRG